MYLVIGSTTILGAHLICTLLQKGQKVRAVKTERSNINSFKKIMRYYFTDYETLFDEIEWVDADTFDPESIANALKDIEIVYYCPNIAILGEKKGDDIITDNLTSTSIIVDQAKKENVKYFCHISNLQALGDESEMKEITEQSARNPKGDYTDYSQASFLSEMEVWRAFEEGLQGSIINAGFILGPGDWKKDNSRIFANINKGCNYYTKGVTGFIGVKDLVRCILSITKQHITNQKFIAVSQCLSFAELSFIIADTFGKKRPKLSVNKSLLKLLKFWYKIKSIFTDNHPNITDSYINLITDFKLYSNKKSIDTLLTNYQPIESVVQEICKLYNNDTSKY